MMQGLGIKDSELKERRKDWETLAEPEKREQKLVDFMQLLVKHIVQEWWMYKFSINLPL